MDSFLSKLKSTDWPKYRKCSLTLLETGILRDLSTCQPKTSQVTWLYWRLLLKMEIFKKQNFSCYSSICTLKSLWNEVTFSDTNQLPMLRLVIQSFQILQTLSASTYMHKPSHTQAYSLILISHFYLYHHDEKIMFKNRFTDLFIPCPTIEHELLFLGCSGDPQLPCPVKMHRRHQTGSTKSEILALGFIRAGFMNRKRGTN